MSESKQSSLERWAEHYATLIRDAQTSVENFPDVKVALDLGSGEGATTSAILRVFPDARITAVDRSIQPVVNDGRVKFVKSTIESFLKNNPESQKFDLVTAGLVDNVSVGVEDLARSLKSGGVIIEWECSLPIPDNNRTFELQDAHGETRVWKRK